MVAHHQRRRHRVVAFAPHRGADRDDLADHGLGRESSAGNDGRDVIDLDTTGHHHSLLTTGAAAILLRRCACRLVS